MTTEMKKVLDLVAEMKEEEKKTVKVPHYFMRKGQKVRRSYDDVVHTDRYNELFYGDAIRSQKVFRCCECGAMVDYFSLEAWACDSDFDSPICSECYESEMGEDL